MLKKLSFLVLGLTILAGVVLPSVLVVDNYDMLLLRCNGTGTTFTDDSTANNKTGQITPHGNATQLPIKFNKSAGFFNGTTDYVVVPDSADWDFGTGDYNVELFFNSTNPASTFTLFDLNTQKLAIIWDYALGRLKVFQAGSIRTYYNWVPVINTWYHIRIRRVSGTTTIYVDGSAQGTPYAGSDDIQGGTSGLNIGKDTDGNNFMKGWIKELRIIKGASTAVTVPTAEYTATSEANTVLLMHFDTPATSPLGPAIAFAGDAGSYIKTASHADFNFTGQFTAEAFFKTTSLAVDGQYIFNRMEQVPSYVGWELIAYPNTGNFKLFSQSGTAIKVFTYAFTANKTIHVVLQRAPTTNVITLMVDGRAIDTVTCANDMTNTKDFLFGENLYGTLREIRISDVARYATTGFTPSQTGFTVDANTKLYIKGNENNGVTTFLDSSTSPKTVTKAGDTKIKYTEDYRSCIFKDETGKVVTPVGSAKVDFFAIGSGVGYFDGSTAYLTILDTDDVDMSNGAFTQEFYVRPSVDMTYNSFLGQYQDGSNLWSFGYDKDYVKFGFLSAGGAGGSAINLLNGAWSYPIPKANIWMHVALTRTANTWTVWVNGTSLGASTESGTIGNMAGLFRVGRGETLYTQGLLDNIRISKGVARYTTTFNPSDDYNAQTVNGQMLSVFN